MKKYILAFLVLVLGLAFFSQKKEEEKTKVLVYVPYEMHFVMQDIKESYEHDHRHIEIQVQELHSNDFEYLTKQGIQILDNFLEERKEADFVSPMLVIGHRRINSLKEMQGSSISIADPDYSAAGVEAIKLLRKAKLWDRLKRSISYKKRAILSMESVDLGEDDFAILSLADAHFIKNCLLLRNFPEEKDFAVRYQIVGYGESEEELAFLDYLHSEKAEKSFQNYGFLATQPEKPDAAISVG